MHEADEEIAYNWFTYVPSFISKEEPVHIWIGGVHGNVITDDYDEVTRQSQLQAEWRMGYADIHRYILLVPAVPRPATNYMYTVAFDRRVFFESTNALNQRPDYKVNLMIDKLIDDLRHDGYTVQERVFIDGFSAGGMFAQRYTLLHPERVQAVAAGQVGGVFTLPESSYNGTTLYWPVGISDFSSLAGYEFDQSAYKQVPQFIFIGDQDLGPVNSTQIVMGRGNSTLWDVGWDETTARSWIIFLDNAFGSTDPEKLENQINYLNSIGYDNITFKIYAGVGHERTQQMITDYLAFFDAYR